MARRDIPEIKGKLKSHGVDCEIVNEFGDLGLKTARVSSMFFFNASFREMLELLHYYP